MKKQHMIASIVVSLILISGVIGLSACASGVSAEPKGGMDAQVNTAVAATLMQRMVETKVAEQSVALVTEPVAQAQATDPAPPTPTPVPTEAAQPTATAEAAQPTPTAPPAPTATPIPASGPKITADENTNCRVGPSTGYKVVTYFMEGAVSTVEGRDEGKDWWYIINPDDSSEFCWVWDGSTTVEGDTSTVPVVAAPSGPNYKTGTLYYGCNTYYPYYTYGCVPYYTNSCVNYYSNNCGKPVKCYPDNFCKKNPQKCNPNKWGACNPYVNCTCKPVYQGTCKAAGCPPVTEVNYQNYCNNYPKCCD